MARVERGQSIHSQLGRVGLPHSTFTEEAINLITRSAEGTLRAVRNLCIGALIEAVRDHTKTQTIEAGNGAGFHVAVGIMDGLQRGGAGVFDFSVLVEDAASRNWFFLRRLRVRPAGCLPAG